MSKRPRIERNKELCQELHCLEEMYREFQAQNDVRFSKEQQKDKDEGFRRVLNDPKRKIAIRECLALL